MSYQIIESHREVGRVEPLCRALGVSVSGDYAWRSREPSQHQQDDTALLKAIRAAYQAGRGLYGSPRIHAALHHQGLRCSRKHVARLMRQSGMHALRRPRRRVRTTDSGHNRPVAPNPLKRDFSAVSPNEKWVGDKGDPYDNAMMESFFSTLRAELTDLQRFPTRQAARTAVFEFIEVFYNRQRLHSSIDYAAPVTMVA